MEERIIKTHEFTKSKLQNLVSENVCRALRYDILNLDYNMKEFKDRINPNCEMFEQKDLIKFYAQTYPLDIGDEIRQSINHIFSHEELAQAYTNLDYSHIYKKLYDYLKNRNYGNKPIARVICVMLDYRMNGYIEEDIHRADY